MMVDEQERQEMSKEETGDKRVTKDGCEEKDKWWEESNQIFTHMFIRFASPICILFLATMVTFQIVRVTKFN
jgi:hypothetical protein